MNKLAYWRAQRHMSVRELEEKSHVSRSTINLLELNKRKAYLVTLTKLAHALDIEVEQLYDLLEARPNT